MTSKTHPALSARICCDSLENQRDLFAIGEDGRKARFGQFTNRWVALITCGFELTKADQYLHLATWGLKLFIVEEPDNCLAKYLHANSDGRIVHVKVSLEPDENLVDRVIEALSRSVYEVYDSGDRPNMEGMKDAGLLSGCWTIWDDGVCLASRIQKALDLPGDCPEIIDICHNKYLSRKALEDKGFKGPRTALLSDLADVEALDPEMRYPLVIKPVNGAASIGVHIVESHKELISNFITFQQSLKEILDEAELMGLVFEDSMISNEKSLLSFCAEEFISGTEYDIDVVLTDGRVVYSNIGQDWPFKPGWMCERGMHHPAKLSPSDTDRLKQYVKTVAAALGCTTGVYHIEIKDDPVMGPQLIECNPRMGGGPVWNFHRKAWGVDLLAEAALSFMGLPNVLDDVREEPYGCVISLLLFSDLSGTLAKSIKSANSDIISNSNTIFFCCPGKAGEEIRGWLGNHYPSHVGRVDFFIPIDDENYESAVEWGNNRRNDVVIPLTTGDHRDPNDCLPLQH